MSLDLVIEILSEAFFAVLIILLPILGSGLIVGVLISIFHLNLNVYFSKFE